MNVSEFLIKNKIAPETIEIDNIVRFFMSEMKNGLEGKNSSLPMINSYCSPNFSLHTDEPIIVIDAGGTNFRTCLVSFDKDMSPVVSDFHKRAMPGIDREVNAREFFSVIADETERLIDKSDRIGFCFSYAAQILPDHDGVPMMFSKEIKAQEVIGKHLGKELLAEFERRGKDVGKKKIIILNDTVTTLLAGLTETEKLGCEGCIGFILGTGTNTAYIEKDTIINIESGNLKLILGDIDKEFLQTTKDPEKYTFEKMISGAYLGPMAHFIFKHAVEEGLFSDSFKLPQSLTTIDLDTMHADTEKDEEILQTIIDSFIQRAAKLTAANLAASILFTNFGKEKPVLINADGTTFYKTAGLEKYTKQYLEEYLNSKGRKAIFTQIDQSPVLGSAIGALSI